MVDGLITDQLRYTALLKVKRLVRFGVDSVCRHFLSMTIFCLSVSLFAAQPWSVASEISKTSPEQQDIAFYQEKGSAFELAFWQPDVRENYLQKLSAGVIDNVASMSEMIASDVHDLLKRPDLERREMGVVVWQYRTSDCVVDFYFDTGIDGSSAQIEALPVDYFEIRERKAVKLGQDVHDIAPDFDAESSQASCLTTLVSDRANDPSKVRKLAALVDKYRG